MFNACILLCLISLCLAKIVLPQEEGTCNIDVSKEERMKRIRANIINQMGLSEEPENPTVPIYVSEEKISELHAVQMSMGISLNNEDSCIETAEFAREKRAFRPHKASTIESNPNSFHTVYHGTGEDHNYGKRDASSIMYPESLPPDTYKLSFNLDLSDQRMFSSAELILFKNIITPQPRTLLTEFETVQVQLVYKTYYYYYEYLLSNEIKETVDTKLVSTNTEEFISLNVTGAIKKWLKVKQVSVGEIDLEVLVRCPEILSSYKKLPPLIKFDVDEHTASNSSAKLIISFVKPEELVDLSGRRRVKKQVGNMLLDADFCFDNPNEPNCCVRELNVNFAQHFGWTWVMSPIEYSPNYCTGACPFFWPKFSNGTGLLQQYKALNPTSAVDPCCAPDSFKPIVLLFTINGEIFLQLINNMEVQTCICR